MAEKIALKEADSDEWLHPIMEGFKMACCDCGLIHSVDFRIKGKRVYMRARRMRELTKQFRKQEGIFHREIKHASEKDKIAWDRGYRSRHPEQRVRKRGSAVRDKTERKVLHGKASDVSRSNRSADHRRNKGKRQHGKKRGNQHA